MLHSGTQRTFCVLLRLLTLKIILWRVWAVILSFRLFILHRRTDLCRMYRKKTFGRSATFLGSKKGFFTPLLEAHSRDTQCSPCSVPMRPFWTVSQKLQPLQTLGPHLPVNSTPPLTPCQPMPWKGDKIIFSSAWFEHKVLESPQHQR